MNTSLRKRAEDILTRSPDETSALPTRDVQELVHELQVHQAELEIQNEELRRTQQELVGARDRYRELYQSVPVGCLTLDANRMIRDANAAATAMLGTGSQELAGQRLDKFVSEEDGDAFYLLMRKAAETGHRQRRDIRFRWAEGCPFWADMEVVPTLCPKTEAFFLLTLSDITARKQAEGQFRTLNAELDHRVKTRTDDLAATNRELESFCYSVSHDLRAPLRSIDAFSKDLLADYGPQLDATGQDLMRRIGSNCERMTLLTDGLLQLSLLAGVQINLWPVDLSAIAQSAAADLRRTEPTRAVDVRIAPGLTAAGDPVLLRTALSNLLENAWKFTGKRTDAVIEFGQTENYPPSVFGPPCSNGGNRSSVFFVRDNGAGFDMRYSDKLFTPFQRLHATADFPGSGVGLATVQRVINRHGGRIGFESAPGQGATFYFTVGENA